MWVEVVHLEAMNQQKSASKPIPPQLDLPAAGEISSSVNSHWKWIRSDRIGQDSHLRI